MTHEELARLCQMSYGDAELAALYPHIEEIGGQGAYAYVLRRFAPAQAVVIFRGTNDAVGWLDDFDCRMVDRPGLGRVHQGFALAWDVLKRRVKAAVQDGPVVLTGHSLGGAVATLAAAELPGVSAVATFGSPRVGDKAFAAAYQPIAGAQTTRYVFDFDPVPWLPGYLAGYRHVAPARWYSGEGWQDGFDWQHLIKLGIHSIQNLLTSWGDWGAFARKLWADHAVANYAQSLRP